MAKSIASQGKKIDNFLKKFTKLDIDFSIDSNCHAEVHKTLDSSGLEEAIQAKGIDMDKVYKILRSSDDRCIYYI